MTQDVDLTCINSAKDAKKVEELLPKELLRLRDSSLEALKSLLADMFDGADDLFFELAESAYSNTDQGLYFEAMREVRIKRLGFEQHFCKQYLNLYVQLLAQPAQEHKPSLDAGPVEAAYRSENFTLVQEDNLEKQVAIDSMITKARSNFSLGLTSLCARIDSLLPKPYRVDEDNNPLDPRQLCQALTAACDIFDLNIKVKLIIFKLFDRHLLSCLDKLLQDSNQILIKLNVLPNLKISLSKSKIGESPTVKESRGREKAKEKDKDKAKELDNNQAPAFNADLTEPRQAIGVGYQDYYESELVTGPGVFSEVQSLFADIRRLGGVSGKVRSGRPVGMPVGSVVLISLLNELEAEFLEELPADLGGPLNREADGVTSHRELNGAQMELPRLDLVKALNQLLESRSKGGVREVINQDDEDAINLVSQIFDFILEDQSLATPVQALLARLQIPTLKVALREKSLFNKPDHPLRLLLNALAASAIGIEEKQDIQNEALFKKIKHLVQRIQGEFDGNVQLFSLLLADFNQFFVVERRKAEIVEQRTRDTEIGQARFQQARSLVKQTLQQLLAGKFLPNKLRETINSGWQSVLFLVCVKEGTESKAWQESLLLIENLIWSLQPGAQKEDQTRWEAVSGDVAEKLRKGLERVSYNSMDITRTLEELELAYQALRQCQIENDSPLPEVQDEGTSLLLGEVEFVHTAAPEIAVDPEPEEPATEASQPEPEVEEASEAKEAKEVGEGSALTADSALERQQAQEERRISECRIQIEQLQPGDWIELRTVDGLKQRCKLTAVIEQTSKFVFVNSRGIKATERTLIELVEDLRRQRLSILNSAPLFDRALSSVLDSLRRIQGKLA